PAGARPVRRAPAGRRPSRRGAHRSGALRPRGSRDHEPVRPRATLRRAGPCPPGAPRHRRGPSRARGGPMTSPVLGYVDRTGPLHRLSGVSKLALALGVVIGAMIGSVVLWLVAIFATLNNIGIFLFAPGYGTELFGTRHVLLEGPWRWDITSEQLFYQSAVTLKYVAVLPSVLLFVATTRPPEFASSLA